MLSIDLNCDVGEGCGSDAELIPLVSSANIACGRHAGDKETMRRTVDIAISKGIAVGAHPGYPDRENFGRRAMDLPLKDIVHMVTDQIAELDEIARSAGGEISHVKPHGALYNQAAREPELAAAIANAVCKFNSGLALYGLSGSVSIEQARKAGLKAVSEVFADRTYQNDGSLTPRSEPNALVPDLQTSITQVLDMIKYGRVRTVEAMMIAIEAETVCIHGDGPNALRIARAIRQALAENEVQIKAVNG